LLLSVLAGYENTGGGGLETTGIGGLEIIGGGSLYWDWA